MRTFTSFTKGKILAVRFSRDGKRLMALGEGTWNFYWEVADPSKYSPLPTDRDASTTSGDISSDQKYIVLGAGAGVNSTTMVNHRFTESRPTKIPAEVNAVVSLGDAQMFAVGDASGQVHLFNAALRTVTGTRARTTTARRSLDWPVMRKRLCWSPWAPTSRS